MNKLLNFIESICFTVLSYIYKLLGKELTEEKFKSFYEFIKFGIVGVSNTLISYIIYSVSLLIFRSLNIFQGIDYLIAQVLQFILSVLWSYYWNNRFVFKLENGEKRSLWKSLLKTYITYSFTGLFLNTILLYLWVDILGINEFIAPIINLLVSVPLNFINNKLWVFKSEKKDA